MKPSICLIIFILLVSTVSAVTIEPSELEFENVLDYAEKTITISSEKSLHISLSATEPFKRWITFSPSSFNINHNSPVDVKVIVQPKNTTKTGAYQGFIVVNTISEGNEMTSSVSTAFDLRITIELTNEKITQANVKNLYVEDIEINNPVKTSIKVQNQGNIELKSFFTIEILDTSNNTIKSAQSEKTSILPLSTETLELEIPNNFDIGKYYANINVYAGEMLLRKHILSFKILEKGTLPAKKESVIIVHPEKIPLSTGPLIILVWIIILLFVIYKISKFKHNKKKK
ncbi:hypothetical protein GF361_04120 [Candidatus Woesearchaeota archaeon]|nr:hypothetical protein [Candidatus Woesearchaeota archaeon]